MPGEQSTVRPSNSSAQRSRDHRRRSFSTCAAYLGHASCIQATGGVAWTPAHTRPARAARRRRRTPDRPAQPKRCCARTQCQSPTFVPLTAISCTSHLASPSPHRAMAHGGDGAAVRRLCAQSWRPQCPRLAACGGCGGPRSGAYGGSADSRASGRCSSGAAAHHHQFLQRLQRRRQQFRGPASPSAGARPPLAPSPLEVSRTC